ncbi:MAG TPA: Gfo/Idh/MocA family oxidoreductase [Gemmataceae bacterium]|nr:Gfo/Idh/MocA family oxidoreductase [Gemmataceae bacterium]
MSRLRVGVVGVGHLGKEHARILATLPEVKLVGVADPNVSQVEAVAQRCGTRAFTDHHALLSLVDAAVIAAPTSHHAALAADFLAHGLPLLVEKPMASTVRQAEEMIELAERHGTLLQVGHIERFNPAFEELRRYPLQPKFITCERYSGFSGRSTDIGVVLDLMIHDLDLVLALVQAPVRTVEALGVAVLGGNEDLAQARVTFTNGCVADLKASRVHPTPVRCMHVFGPEGFAGVDFARRHLTLMQPSEHLQHRRLDSRHLDAATLASLKTELFGRHVQVQELDCNAGDQLTRELQEFLQCVRTGRRPRVDGTSGRDALALAGRILDSLRAHAWEGVEGPSGPWQLPAPRGTLFIPPSKPLAA